MNGFLMNSYGLRFLLLVFACILLVPASGFAQDGQVRELSETPDRPTAQALYEEANNYGFVVADSPINDLNYGAFSLPMSFLIDRRGRVRFIALGAHDLETTALGKMIKQLVAEPVPLPVTTPKADDSKGLLDSRFDSRK
ncbi:MAG: hypothetical protein M3410_16305 [Acidobacteriota bacterium]|nr:hypothetical protein [Acidobacteriota bacterium]